MDVREITVDGRKYKAYVSGEDQQNGSYIIIGPPEGLVDAFPLPKELLDRLHNSLFDRGIFTIADAYKKPKDILGALQETLMVDVQKITELYAQFCKES